MKAKKLHLFIAVLGTLFLQVNLFGQFNPTFKVTPLVAKIYNQADKKDVVVVFHVTTKDTADFPPVLSFPFKCSTFDGSKETAFDPTKENVHIILNDSNIVKNEMVYQLIKDKVDLKTKDKFFIINFYLKDMTAGPIQSLEFYFALKEKRHQDIRVEEKFTFDVIQ